MGVTLAQDNKLIRSLVQNTKLGNNASFEQLFKLNAGRVYSVCLRLSADSSIAEEITKEVFVTTWQQILHLRENVSFSLWLTAIAVYTVLDKFRDKNSLAKLSGGSKTTGAPYDTDNEEALRIEKSILNLPDRDRFILVLHDIEKYSDLEVSDLLAMKTDDLNNRLNIIRESLVLAGRVSPDKPIQEKLKLLPYNIEPPHNLWVEISKQLRQIKSHAADTETDNGKKEEDPQNEKKGVLSWFKKK